MTIFQRLSKKLIFLSTLLVLSACATSTMVEPTENSQERDQVIYAPLAGHIAQSSEQAIAAFGKPLTEVKRTLETLHDEQANQWRELNYADLKLGYFVDPQTGKEVLAYQRIASERYPLKANLRIGQNLADFEAVLGKPDRQSANQADFCDRWGRGDCIQLSLSGQHVTALEQVFSMD